MMNMTNELGTRLTTRTARIVGVLVALAAATLLVAEASAQELDEGIQITGTVVDATNQAVVVGAWVSIAGSDWGSISDDQGRFRLEDLTAGPIALQVEQLGYEKLDWVGELVEGESSTLQLQLEPQPVLLEGLEVVANRFESRRRAQATTVQAFELDDLVTTSQRTALEFIEQRIGVPATFCNGRRGDTCLIVRGRTVEPSVYIDEAPVLGGLEYLQALAPYELYMIEIFGRGQHIRAYTPAYMERAAKQRLQPIALLF